MTVRLTTFNAENLFVRFKFNSDIDPQDAVREGWDANDVAFRPLADSNKDLTATAIKATNSDIVCLQEVENLDTLKHFRSKFLGGSPRFPHALAVDGNDPRLIDVAILSRWPITHVRTWQHLREGREELFSRDCLEADVETPEGVLHLYVQHFKSMLDKSDAANGRRNTRARRRLQARKVIDLIEDRFGPDCGDRPIAILGDFNDYRTRDSQGSSGILDLLNWPHAENVVERLPRQDRWTHYFKGNQHVAAGYHQLDYVLLSTALAANLVGPPEILRQGQPARATRYTGPRFDGVGHNEPKASDHCPVTVELRL